MDRDNKDGQVCRCLPAAEVLEINQDSQENTHGLENGKQHPKGDGRLLHPPAPLARGGVLAAMHG